MKSPKEREEERLKQEAEQKKQRSLYVKYKMRVLSDIANTGLLSVKYKLEALQEQPTLHPDNGLTYAETIACIREAIDHHLNKQKS